MKRSLTGTIVGVMALAGVVLGSADAGAMPVQPLGSTAAPAESMEHVYWRGGYGFHRGYGYGFRRPYFYGYGYRRPFYGYGYRRPFYGYGWRRYGFRRW